MVYRNYNVTVNFHFSCSLYTPELTHYFPTSIRYFDTDGVMRHLDFMRKRTLCMYNLEKLLAA